MKKLIIVMLVFFTNTALSENLFTNNPIDLSADIIEFDEKNKIITATGNVEIIQDTQRLKANKIIYNMNQDTVYANGNVVFYEKHNYTFFVSELLLSDKMRMAVIKALVLKFADQSEMMAKEAIKYPNNNIEIKQGEYTPCKYICNVSKPLWSISAKKVIINNEKQKVYYESPKFHIKGLSVMFLPYLSHPTPKAERSTGFLSPDILSNSYLGQAVKLPFYYNISSNSDLTISPQFTSKKGIVLFSEYRYLSEYGLTELNFSITHDKHYSKIVESKEQIKSKYRGIISFKGYYDLNPYFVDMNINMTSDKNYIKVYDIKQYQKIKYNYLTSRLALNHYNHKDYTSLEAISFQNLRTQGALNQVPTVLPKFHMHRELTIFDDNNYFVDLNFLGLYKQDKTDLNRFSGTFGWNYPYITNSGDIINIVSTLRQDLYLYGFDDKTNRRKYIQRTIPQIKIEWAKPYYGYLKTYQAVIEPMVNTIIMPNKNYNKNIIQQDSQVISMSDSNLFSDYRTSGTDFVENSYRINYGIKADFYGNKQNSDKVSILVGQSYAKPILRDQTELVYKNFILGKKHSFSDYFTSLEYKFKDKYQIFLRLIIDKNNLKLKKQDIEYNHHFNNLSFKINYISIKDDIEQSNGDKNNKDLIFETILNTESEWRIWAKGHTKLNRKQSIKSNRKNIINLSGGISKVSDCITTSLGIERDYTKTEDKKPSNTFSLKILLKNLM